HDRREDQREREEPDDATGAATGPAPVPAVAVAVARAAPPARAGCGRLGAPGRGWLAGPGGCPVPPVPRWVRARSGAPAACRAVDRRSGSSSGVLHTVIRTPWARRMARRVGAVASPPGRRC